MILFDGVILGIVAGWASGGSLASLLVKRIRGEGLLLGALVFQIILPSLATRSGVPPAAAFALWLGLMLFTCLIGLYNMNVRGMLLVSTGIALNMLVIALNGAMPVSAEAALWVDPGTSITILEEDPFHEPLNGYTLLPWLSDVVGIPGPRWHRGVASVGDLILVTGLAVYCFDGTRQSRV